MPPRKQVARTEASRYSGQLRKPIADSPLRTRKGFVVTTRAQSKHFQKFMSMLEHYVTSGHKDDDSGAVDDFDFQGMSSNQFEASAEQVGTGGKTNAFKLRFSLQKVAGFNSSDLQSVGALSEEAAKDDSKEDVRIEVVEEVAGASAKAATRSKILKPARATY